MKGLYLKILDHNQKLSTIKISALRINESSKSTDKKSIPIGKWLTINKESEIEGDAYKFIKCFHCGHHDFNNDVESLNDYACNACGLTISAAQ